MDFIKELNQKAEYVNRYIASVFDDMDNLQKSIYDAMKYSLFAGGKKLRPVIMLATCEMLGGNIEYIMPFATAIEMIHTYSLIHDDLPALDNDDLRRGRKTNHIVYGEAMAILAGDALLNKAFEIPLRVDTGLSASIKVKALEFLSKMSGTEGMIGGQVVDIESENKQVDIETLYYMHSLKTGALIRASAVIGAMVSGASEETVGKIDDFAKNLGIAFQIQDDILDVEGDTALLGKNVGSDEENNKSTFVTILGIEKCRQLVVEYSREAQASLDVFGEKSLFLKELTKYLINRKY